MLVGLVVGACSAAPAEPAGVGRWDVTRTQLHDASGRCEPTDLPDGRKGTYCFMQPALGVAGQNAQVDLYFGGVAPESPLIELQLKINVCDPEKLDAWARTTFGTAAEHHADRTLWKNRYLYALLLPAGAHCRFSVLPLSEDREARRIFTAP